MRNHSHVPAVIDMNIVFFTSITAINLQCAHGCNGSMLQNFAMLKVANSNMVQGSK